MTYTPDFLAGIYEKAMREWNLDGFKLDFIDSFSFPADGDPAIAEDYRGRDIKSLPEAVDRLLKDVYARLSRIRKDVLLEFRQSYIGPAVRQYGNMLRVGDCPGHLLQNRKGIANLRLTSGKTAVHSDMLEWNGNESAENAARAIISSIFGVIQYSVMLGNSSDDHVKMISNWIDFSKKHRNALLKGGFRAYHPELDYPLLESWDDTERIIATYAENQVINADLSDERTIYILNGADSSSCCLELSSGCKAQIFDTFGTMAGTVSLDGGLTSISIPKGGYLKIARL